MERSEIQFGNTPISYVIVRGRRQKTVAIGVDAIEGVRVRAPQDTPIAKLDEIVRRKGKWIVDRRRRHEDLAPPPSSREFVSGETFLYLGRQYRLKVASPARGEIPRVRMVGGFLHVPVAHGEVRSQEARRLLVEWYRDHAARRLPERVAIWAERLGLVPAEVLIRDQQKRWGSADSQGNLRVNWRVVQAPLRLADYVVAHELVHLRFPNHTPGFWATLGEAMSDYEVRRESLRRMGREMIW